MRLKLAILNLVAISFLFITSSVMAALQFAINNYSDFAALSYDYSFDGKDWTWCAFLPAVTQNPKSFVKLPFTPMLPIAWRLEGTNGKQLRCEDYFTHQEVPSIITLKDATYTQMDMLMLDVFPSGNAANKFLAQIIDLDGEKEYSNVIECGYANR